MLMYVLETINGTVLYKNSRHVESIAFLLLCDELFRFVLEERHAHPESSMTDLSTSFGWCACSGPWRYAAKTAVGTKFTQWTTNAKSFLAEIDSGFAFHTPRALSPPAERTTNNRKRIAYESPDSDRKRAVARSLSENAIRIEL